MRKELVGCLALAALALAGCINAPKPAQQRSDPAMSAFEAKLLASIKSQTLESLHRRSLAERGYVLVQFHYLDGKITDAEGVYLLGERQMLEDVTQQLLQVQAPPPIPEIVGQRTRFVVGFCFMDQDACDEREKRALAAVKPEPGDDPNENHK